MKKNDTPPENIPSDEEMRKIDSLTAYSATKRSFYTVCTAAECVLFASPAYGKVFDHFGPVAGILITAGICAGCYFAAKAFIGYALAKMIRSLFDAANQKGEEK